MEFDDICFAGAIIMRTNTADDGCRIAAEGRFESVQRGEFGYFRFLLICSEKPQDMKNCVIMSMDIKQAGSGYDAVMELSDGDGNFTVKGLIPEKPWLKHYLGFSYRNVYGTEEYEKYMAKYDYVFDEKYLEDTDTENITDDLSAEISEYSHILKQSEQFTSAVTMSRIRLIRDGEVIYEGKAHDSVHTFKELIHHSDGHRYFPFRQGLYGLCLYDMESGEIYHYIPEGYDNSYGMPMGESFIICSIHYDVGTDLIAYEGCYWAAYYDVRVGGFSAAMPYDPHLVSIHDIIDPGYDKYYDIDLIRWDKDAIIVKAEHDDGCDELTISVNDIRKAIYELKKKAEDNNEVV